MKKLLLITTIILCLSFSLDNNESEISQTVATYNGKSDKAYYFTNVETGDVMEFKFINIELLSKHDFSNKALIGKKMKLTYYIDYDEVETKTQDNKVDAKTTMKRLTLFKLEEKVD